MIGRRSVLAGIAATGAARAAAAAEERVTVYTAHESAIVEQLVPGFQRATGIAVDVIKGGGGDLLNRVRAEAASPRCDVIWSVGGEQLESNPALLQAYMPEGLQAVLDPKFPVSGNWLPYTGVVMVIAVNTAKLKPADYPRSWADLAAPRFKSMVSSARADSSSSAFIQYVTILSAYGDKGPEMYASISKNFALSDSSGAVPRYVNDGEALAGLTLEDNALQYVKGGGQLAIVYPADGTTTGADGIALVKGAPHAAQGRKFIDYLVSQPVQKILVDSVGRRSIRTDVPPNPAVPPMAGIRTVAYDMAGAARDRVALLAKWKRIADSQ